MTANKIGIVTMDRLNRALDVVVNELSDHGLWCSRLEKVPVYLSSLSTAHGYILTGERHEVAEIYIPKFSGSRLLDKVLSGRQYTSLADVLRHEYGHALAHVHRGLIRSREFVKAFDYSHDSDIKMDFDPEIHISDYAATNPSEDWAETVMFFLKHQGRLPRIHDTVPKRIKWAFVKTFITQVRSGRRIWT
jgi:hypothetical protein